MRPIMLKGHERALTKVMYNLDGDLLFSAAKDNCPTVWYANGERLGTFNGHQGAVVDMDVSHDSAQLVTASADATIRLWKVENGELIKRFSATGPVRAVAWSEGSRFFAAAMDPFGSDPAQIAVWAVPKDGEIADVPMEDRIFLIPVEFRATNIAWVRHNTCLLVTYDDGSVRLLDSFTGEVVETHQIHKHKVQDLQFSKDRTLIITASYDNTAKLLDATTLEVLQTFETDRPVNAAAISPIREHIVIGGGQDAMSVTTTAGQQGKFEARFWHMWHAKEFGRVRGHFGPINCIAINPDGRSYASGGEDGYVRLHVFDPSYYEIEDIVPEDFDVEAAKKMLEDAGVAEEDDNDE